MDLCTWYYGGLLAASVLLTVIYVFRWHKHFDVHMTALYLLIPITNLAFFFLYLEHDVNTAMFALKIIYIGGCFLPWLILMCVTSLCRIPVRRWVRTATYLLSTVMYCCVLTIGYYPFFYESLDMTQQGSAWVMHKEYGPLHTVFYAVIGLYFLANLAVIFYCFFKKKQVSRQMLLLLVVPTLISMAGYAVNHITGASGYEVLPLTYVLAQLVYLSISHRMVLYDVSETVVESMVQSGDTGFISIDLKNRYLGSNETAREILPELTRLTVDRSILRSEALRDNVLQWLDHFKTGQDAEKDLYVRHDPTGASEDKIYAVRVSHLYDGRHMMGYQIFLEDDTQNQKYIHLLDQYNSALQEEVDRQTRIARERADRLESMSEETVRTLAMAIDAKDRYTNGHSLRVASYSIALAAELGWEEEALKTLWREALLHDIGKIGIPDAVLNKPGRLEREEFETVKSHTTIGGRILARSESLLDAAAVARHHHERYDGTGYPSGLAGEDIPFHARVVSIADAYDAMRSDRIYRKGLSPDVIRGELVRGSGTQFDPALLSVFLQMADSGTLDETTKQVNRRLAQV